MAVATKMEIKDCNISFECKYSILGIFLIFALSSKKSIGFESHLFINNF